MAETIESLIAPPECSKAQRLKWKMLEDGIFSIEPVLSPVSAHGFSYPLVNDVLGTTTMETIAIMETLAHENTVEKRPFSLVHACPRCRSTNLKTSQGCPECGSIDIRRGRMLEHFSCAYLGLEEEFIPSGKHICPRCRNEARFLGTDYNSLGIRYKCRTCSHIFIDPVPLHHCLECSNTFASSSVLDTTIYSYHVTEEQIIRLRFEFGLTARLVKFLETRGYSVTLKTIAAGSSKSGAKHAFDLLATRDDGFINHTICADVIINHTGKEIGLEKVFTFDDKAYDLGIHDKVLFVIPRLDKNAAQLARRQNIRVYQDRELEVLLDSIHQSNPSPPDRKPFMFATKSDFLKHLQDTGYIIKEHTTTKGRSGAVHTMDMLAYRDDGIVTHVVNIGITVGEPLVGIDTVFLYDTRSFDAGIHDKVLLASPGLTPEAKQFALHQKISVIEVPDANKLI